jgi:cytochrome c biogenesis protein CcmG, thiol:disulfide interchange protein DsbE
MTRNAKTIRVALWVAGGLGVCLALIGGAYAMRVPRRAAHPEPAAAAQQQPVIYFVKNPEPTPAFQVKDLTGKTISPADWKGKAVLLNFWATWCPPCREEIPSLIALQRKYGSRLVVVGISEDDDSPEEVLKFVQRVGINYPVAMSTPQIVAAWGGVEALPTTFLINAQGRVVGKQRGLHSVEEYDRDIKALLGDPVDARIETIADQGQVFLKNASNATELPDVDFTGLNAEQKKLALHRLNAETCTCGCKLTVAQCRLNDTTCPVSKTLAAKIVKEVVSASTAAPGTVKRLTAN